jgi:hypothetical protein
VNSNEHFAEVYAKAVHLPVSLHDDLVAKPTAAAEAAQQKVSELKSQIETLQADPNATNREARLAALKQKLSLATADATKKETAKQQRGDQFKVMRNDVFHTDKATALALERLKAKKVSAKKVKEFESAAATMSTPEQIATLERKRSNEPAYLPPHGRRERLRRRRPAPTETSAETARRGQRRKLGPHGNERDQPSRVRQAASRRESHRLAWRRARAGHA